MIAAICCPGPSLDGAEIDRTAYAELVAVNRASNLPGLYPDTIVCMDPHTAGWLTHESTASMPALCGKPGVLNRIERTYPLLRGLERIEIVPRWTDFPPTNWHTKGLAAGLVFAWKRGAKRIDCFGVDWDGRSDYDGFEHERQKRDERRWAAERSMVTRLAHELRKRGAEVNGLPVKRQLLAAGCEEGG